MPLYDLWCECGYQDERVLGMNQTLPQCPECGDDLEIKYSAPPMVKVKGEGGYPSRRRQIFNTTSRNHPPLEKHKNKISI